MYATVSELKELKEWLLGGCKDINEQPRTELEQEIKIKDKLIKELNNDNDTLLSYQKELETKIQDLESDPRLSTCFDDFIEGFKEDVTYELKKELEVLKAEYASLKTENSELRKANQAYLSYQFKLEEKTKELEKGITYWKTQSKEIALAKNPNEELQKENQELKDELNLSNEVIELQANLIEAKAIVDLYLSNIESLKKDNSNLKEVNSNLKEVNNKMFQSNEKLSKEIEHLNLENNKVYARNSKLKKDLRDMLVESSNLEKELLKTKQLLDIELNKNIPF